jgi:hypothetical protein
MKEKKMTLLQKLVSIMDETGALKPDSRNDFLKYNYISINQVKAFFQKKFADYKILFKLDIERIEINGELTTVYGTIQLIDTEAENEEKLVFKVAGQGFDSQGKGLSKAKSDLVKRFFTDNFLIASADEDDEVQYNNLPKKEARQENRQVSEPNRQYSEDKPATSRQIEYIAGLLNKGNLKLSDVLEELGFNEKKSLKELTLNEAKAVIEYLLNL